MTHIVTRLCLRDTACVDVCPVECMVLGFPQEKWPWLYIDPDTCIDCGACIPACPFEAIFPEEEVPFDHQVQDLHGGGTYVAHRKDVYADGTVLKDAQLLSNQKHPVNVDNAKLIPAGTILDLTDDIPDNYDFFTEGPGYDSAPDGA